MTENRYDLVPYTSHPFEHTTPENLATLARLFGMEAVDYRKARVLELGCASGGNIIPLAEVHPECDFVGVDLSGKQIAEGQANIVELGLNNVSLREMSLADIAPDFGTFDYIIAHGLYSWVDQPLQRKILEICKQNLSENGLAFISYNTLPGWNMVRTIRDMMVYHTRSITDPQQKATQARSILQFMIEGMEGNENPYALMLKQEMTMLARHGDYYLLHDHMEENNLPVYFHEFMRDAREQGLEYVADSDLETMLVDNLPKKVADKLREAKEIVHIEQYMDFFRNRRFRNTILCHKGIPLKRNITQERIEDFYLSTMLKSEETLGEEQLKEGVEVTFKVSNVSMSTSSRLAKLALKYLVDQHDAPVSFNALTEWVMEQSGHQDRGEVAEHLRNKLNLITLVFKKAIKLRLTPGEYARSVPEQPELLHCARVLASKQDMVPNMRHQNVQIQAMERLFMPCVDGTHNLEQLTDKLQEHYRQGKFTLNLSNEPSLTDDEVRRHLRQVCENQLRRYCRLALLKQPAS